MAITSIGRLHPFNFELCLVTLIFMEIKLYFCNQSYRKVWGI